MQDSSANEMVIDFSRDLTLDEMVGEFRPAVQSLLQEMTNLWWACSSDFYELRNSYTEKEQVINEQMMDSMTKALVNEIKRNPNTIQQREILQEFLRSRMSDFAAVLHLGKEDLDFIESSGMVTAVREFGKMARRFDPNISAEDIYQAGRNVMTGAFIQLLLGKPVEVTPSIFAYSMLYPYTDNYLDDSEISFETKANFNKRFERCLKGEPIRPLNHHEENIRNLVSIIEEQWERTQFPGVYASLLAIQAAQVQSLGLVAPGAAPYQKDVLGISFEKGGTSVLADGYLVAGALTRAQARYLFGYGAFTQLMDDLEDMEQDQREGRLTIFTQSVPQWTLDRITNQFFHFGHALFDDCSAFDSEAVPRLKQLITKCLDPILIDIVGREAQHYSLAHLRRMEKGFPFRFAKLKKLRERWAHQHLDLGGLVEAML